MGASGCREPAAAPPSGWAGCARTCAAPKSHLVCTVSTEPLPPKPPCSRPQPARVLGGAGRRVGTRPRSLGPLATPDRAALRLGAWTAHGEWQPEQSRSRTGELVCGAVGAEPAVSGVAAPTVVGEVPSPGWVSEDLYRCSNYGVTEPDSAVENRPVLGARSTHESSMPETLVGCMHGQLAGRGRFAILH